MNQNYRASVEPKVLDKNLEERNKKNFQRLYQEKKGILIEIRGLEKDSLEWNQVKDYEDREREFVNVIRQYNKDVEAAKLGYSNVPICKFDFSGVAYLMVLAYGAKLLKVNHLINAEHVYSTLDKARNFEPQVDYNSLDKIYEALKNSSGGVWCVNNHPWQQKNRALKPTMNQSSKQLTKLEILPACE